MAFRWHPRTRNFPAPLIVSLQILSMHRSYMVAEVALAGPRHLALLLAARARVEAGSVPHGDEELLRQNVVCNKTHGNYSLN